MKNTTNNNKRQNQVLNLHPNEAELIFLMRNRVRFGFVEIVVKDGLPMRITKRVEDYSCTVDNVFDEENMNGKI